MGRGYVRQSVAPIFILELPRTTAFRITNCLSQVSKDGWIFASLLIFALSLSGRFPTLGRLEAAWRGRDRDLKTAGAPPSVSMRTCGVVRRTPCCRIAERGGQAITRGRQGTPLLSIQSHPTDRLVPRL